LHCDAGNISVAQLSQTTVTAGGAETAELFHKNSRRSQRALRWSLWVVVWAGAIAGSVRPQPDVNAISTASAKWMACRPVAWRICSRQLNPSETMIVSGAA